MNITNAIDLKLGQSFTYNGYGEPCVLVLIGKEYHANHLGEWYDQDKADTLNSIGTPTLTLIVTTIDGLFSDYLLVSPAEPFVVVEDVS